jgi:mono/diheme cytochrome c family protein
MAVGLLCCRLAAAEPPSEKDGAAVYKARCARCHGDNGKTDTSVGRVLKVAPLVDDPRLARMAPAAIAQLVMSDPKHRGVVDLDEDDVKAAAVFVKRLAAGR